MSKVERLVNLTVALLETPRPLTLEELRQKTRYYTQDDERASRRMFERDKDELRTLGVPIETRDRPFSEDVGYIIDRKAYELPDVDLTSDEVAALALAVRVTDDPGAPLALAKLAARAPDPGELPETTTRVALETSAVGVVAPAVLSRTSVEFTYRTADGNTSTRRIDPYGVVRRRAAWYLVGRDHDRDAMRSFRLDRIIKPPREVGEPNAFVVPDDIALAAITRGPDHTPAPIELAVTDGARWAVELRGGRDTGRLHHERAVFEVASANPMGDRAWILSLGADATVLAPPEVRDAVENALRRLTGQVG